MHPGAGRAGDRLRVRVFDAVIKNLGIMQARDDGTTAELRLGRSPAKRLAALDAGIVIHEDDNPTFVQARDAVLAAIDALHQGGAITPAERDTALPAARRAFRERGLGTHASSKGKALSDARADFT